MLGSTVLLRWLVAFMFTQVLECPIYAVSLGQEPRSRFRRLAIAFGASTLTHPVVWFVFPMLWREIHRPGGYWGMVGAAETFAVVAEAAYLRWGFGVRRALLWALLANTVSASLAFLSRSLVGWP